MSEIMTASKHNFTNSLSLYCWSRYSRTRWIASFLTNFYLFWKEWSIPFEWFNHSLGAIFFTESIPNKDVCWTKHWLKNISEDFFQIRTPFIQFHDTTLICTMIYKYGFKWLFVLFWIRYSFFFLISVCFFFFNFVSIYFSYFLIIICYFFSFSIFISLLFAFSTYVLIT